MFARLLPEEFVVEVGDPRLPASALLEAERALVARAVPKRRDEYAAGRNCARAALARLGVHDFALLAGSAREPIWPEGVIGSMTPGTRSSFKSRASARTGVPWSNRRGIRACGRCRARV